MELNANKQQAIREGSTISLSSNGLHREGQVTSILPLSQWHISVGNNEESAQAEHRVRVVNDFRVYTEVSSFLAYSHFNDRSGEVLVDLPNRLRGCDFFMSLEQRDSMYSPIYAARQMLEALQIKTGRNTRPRKEPSGDSSRKLGLSQGINGSIRIKNRSRRRKLESNQAFNASSINQTMMNASSTNQSTTDDGLLKYIAPKDRTPFAVLGALQPSVTQTLNILGQASELPLINPSSNSASFGGKSFFASAASTNEGVAWAIAEYLTSLNVIHTGILYQDDSWGRAFYSDLVKEFNSRSIQMASSSYSVTNMEASIRYLSLKNAKYIVAILDPTTWQQIVRHAINYEIIGKPEYTWVLTEGNPDFISPFFNLDRETNMEIAKALHGSALISTEPRYHEQFHDALENFGKNKTLQNEFVMLHSEREIFEGYNFSGLSAVYSGRKLMPGFKFPDPISYLYPYRNYDSVITLGIAACETPGLFTGRELYQNLLKTEFNGVSGVVNVGQKSFDKVQFSVRNMLLSEERLEINKCIFTTEITDLISTEKINNVKKFIFANNSTVPPVSLPPVQENLNLISAANIKTARCFGCLACVSSLYCIIWIYRNKCVPSVQVAQPLFLLQVSVGIMIISTVVIPLSLQEPLPKQYLDASCVSIPWLLSLGFAITSSGLLAKTYRINLLVEATKTLKRTKVKHRTVMKPIVAQMTINVALLVAWTLVEQPKWAREALHQDIYGRTTSSYGMCRVITYKSLVFWLPIVLTNVLVLLMAFYLIFTSRDLPEEFSETNFIASSIFVACVLLLPPLFATTRPIERYWISIIFISAISFGTLLPVLMPKISRARSRKQISEKAILRKLALSIKQSLSRDSHNSRIAIQNNLRLNVHRQRRKRSMEHEKATHLERKVNRRSTM